MSGFRLKLTLLVTALFPLLTGLGVWQLSRFQEKRNLEQIYESRQSMSPVSIAVAGQYEDPLYLPVNVSGHFVADQYFLLDNQVFQGRAGYELIMPFITDEGQWLWVNRGWLPAGDREQMPAVHTDSERLMLSGILYQPLGKAFLLSDELWLEPSGQDWPKRIQAIDFARMALALSQYVKNDVKKHVKTEVPLFMPSFMPSIMVVLNKPQPGAEQYRPVMMNVRSEKHLGYAFQWFAMALVLAGLYGYHMVRSGKGGGHAWNDG